MNTPLADGNLPPLEPAGSVVYEVTYTDEHVVELWKRSRKLKRGSRMFMRIFRVVAGVILAALIALVFKVAPWQQWYLAVALCGILGVLVFSEQIDGWLLVRRWRKAHSRNKQARIIFSSEGYRGQSDVSQTMSHWAAFTAATRFPDGFLIFAGPYLPSWHRHADLVQGTPDDAAALFQANIAAYKET